ncbi:MAG: hypothetical protein HS116_06795 [Planctomycetes bacterium]|nr:hypothetical protein [Planctomycetota bacterium]
MLPASVPTPEWDQPPRRFAGTAVLGALLLGILVPCLLTFWFSGHSGLTGAFLEAPERPDEGRWDFSELVWLISVASIGCGPGALILSGILIGLFRLLMRQEGRAWQVWKSERYFMQAGFAAGALAAFANFPGYLVVDLLNHHDGLRLLRVFTLFAVTGATCGTWIAWQVYREFHPELGLFPRVSLSGLVVLVLGWSTLLFLFQPA